MAKVIIFQGNGLFGFNHNPDPTNIIIVGNPANGFRMTDITDDILNQITPMTRIFIHVHGRAELLNGNPKHEIQINANEWIRTSDLFKALAPDPQHQQPLHICLTSCKAGSARSDKVLRAKIPKGSFIAFFASKDSQPLAEVNERLIMESIRIDANNTDAIRRNFWLISPFTESSFLYVKPNGTFSEFTQPLVSYNGLVDEIALAKQRKLNCDRFNNFFQTQAKLTPIQVDHNIPDIRNWYKDLWFMLMVTWLVNNNERPNVINYLHSHVNGLLRCHAASLAHKPIFNLLQYFNDWQDQNVLPQLQQIAGDFNPPIAAHAAMIVNP